MEFCRTTLANCRQALANYIKDRCNSGLVKLPEASVDTALAVLPYIQ